MKEFAFKFEDFKMAYLFVEFAESLGWKYDSEFTALTEESFNKEYQWLYFAGEDGFDDSNIKDSFSLTYLSDEFKEENAIDVYTVYSLKDYSKAKIILRVLSEHLTKFKTFTPEQAQSILDEIDSIKL